MWRINGAISFAGAGGDSSRLKLGQQPSSHFAMIHLPTTPESFF
jgi:hypothetical protein